MIIIYIIARFIIMNINRLIMIIMNRLITININKIKPLFLFINKLFLCIKIYHISLSIIVITHYIIIVITLRIML